MRCSISSIADSYRITLVWHLRLSYVHARAETRKKQRPLSLFCNKQTRNFLVTSNVNIKTRLCIILPGICRACYNVLQWKYLIWERNAKLLILCSWREILRIVHEVLSSSDLQSVICSLTHFPTRVTWYYVHVLTREGGRASQNGNVLLVPVTFFFRAHCYVIANEPPFM